MRVKRIQIKSVEEALKEFKETYRKLSRGEKVKKPTREVYFENLQAVRNVLTEERLRLLRAIKRHKPSSIYKLARLVVRDFKNVNRDVHLLAGLGIIELSVEERAGQPVRPELLCDSIEVRIAI